LESKTTETAPEISDPRTEIKKIGFVCSPSAYVAFRYLYPETLPHPDERRDRITVESYLFDYDERFSLLTPPQHILTDPWKSERFVQYDLNKLLVFPPSLERQLDMVIIDPPYLKAETNVNIAQTVKKLLKSENDGKILLITGQSIAEQACEIYGNETTRPLRRAEKLEVEHVGLKNEFGAWGNWDGVERFGSLKEYMQWRKL
jgi:EEF1A lysine methyltransferase 1